MPRQPACPLPGPPPALLVRRARRRARAEGVLLALTTVGVALCWPDPVSGLTAAALTLSAGLLLFLWRRGRDLDAVARARHAESRALEGRGISLADWHAGRPLPGPPAAP